MLVSFEMQDPVIADTGKPGLTINRTTLFGDLEAFLMSAYAIAGGRAADANAGRDLSAHIARGVAFLNLRTSNLTDFLDILYKPNMDSASLKAP